MVGDNDTNANQDEEDSEAEESVTQSWVGESGQLAASHVNELELCRKDAQRMNEDRVIDGETSQPSQCDANTNLLWRKLLISKVATSHW